jgi:hypothetical protein
MLASSRKMTRHVNVDAPYPDAVYGNPGTTPTDRERGIAQRHAAIVDDRKNMLTLRRCPQRVKT